MNKKDNRRSFNHQRVITANNDVLHFDGKLNLDNMEMKVYRLYGSVLAFQDAYTAIGIEYKCSKVYGA